MCSMMGSASWRSLQCGMSFDGPGTGKLVFIKKTKGALLDCGGWKSSCAVSPRGRQLSDQGSTPARGIYRRGIYLVPVRLGGTIGVAEQNKIRPGVGRRWGVPE